MAFLGPIVAEGAEALGAFLAEEVGTELGGVAEEVLTSKVGKGLAGSALGFGVNKLWGSFFGDDDEDNYDPQGGGSAAGRGIIERDGNIYAPNRLPLSKIMVSPSVAKSSAAVIPVRIVDDKPSGFRLHYKEPPVKVGIFKVPKDQTYYPVQREQRGTNEQFGNTGGFT